MHDIHKVETAIEPRFQEHFVNANAIPHATDPFPELHKIVTLPEVSFNTGGSGEGGRRQTSRLRLGQTTQGRYCRPMGKRLTDE